MLHTKTVHRFYFYNFPKKNWKICCWGTCWKVFCHQITPSSIRDDNTNQDYKAQDGLLSANLWYICHVKNHPPKSSLSTLPHHGEDLQCILKETLTVLFVRNKFLWKLKSWFWRIRTTTPLQHIWELWNGCCPDTPVLLLVPTEELRKIWRCWPVPRGEDLPSRRGLVLTAVTVVTTVPQGITVRSFSILVASTGEETCLAFSSLGSIKENWGDRTAPFQKHSQARRIPFLAGTP